MCSKIIVVDTCILLKYGLLHKKDHIVCRTFFKHNTDKKYFIGPVRDEYRDEINYKFNQVYEALKKVYEACEIENKDPEATINSIALKFPKLKDFFSFILKNRMVGKLMYLSKANILEKIAYLKGGLYEIPGYLKSQKKLFNLPKNIIEIAEDEMLKPEFIEKDDQLRNIFGEKIDEITDRKILIYSYMLTKRDMLDEEISLLTFDKKMIRNRTKIGEILPKLKVEDVRHISERY